MARRIFDLFSKLGIETVLTSFSTHGKLLIDTKVKAAKMKVTMGSLMTAALIKGLPQVKTRDDMIEIISKEYGLNVESVKKLAIDMDQGEMDNTTSDTTKNKEKVEEVKEA